MVQKEIIVQLENIYFILTRAWSLKISFCNFSQNLFILSDITKEIKKTKQFYNFLEKNKLSNVVIISDTNSLKNINKSARNIKNLKLLNDAGANIYDMLKFKNVLFTISSIKNLQKRLVDEKN